MSSSTITPAPTPMRAQLTASDPQLSVWVSANAGTGKTKVLTDRVLRLLLAGTSPARILCITYTKAAAAEMENRIHRTLSTWVGMDDTALAAALHALNDAPPDDILLRRARSLFATVLDAPEGVRIQTIHSLCQSLLRRFPLEAGVQPHFEVIDERTALELLAEARMRLFTRSLAAAPEDEELVQAVQTLSARLGEVQFQELLVQWVKERRNLMPLLAQASGARRLQRRIWQALDVKPEDTDESVFATIFDYSADEEKALREAINYLEEGKKTDKGRARVLCRWLEQGSSGRYDMVADYAKCWLTKEGEAAKQLLTLDVNKAYPHLQALLLAEQNRMLEYQQRQRAMVAARLNVCAVVVVDAIFSIYSHLKSVHQFLDYDDLVLLALRLLRREGVAQWVLYKLDGGLDHVLIDEAQDTSPEQWQLVGKLIEEFFAGAGSADAQERHRTMFVVGDEKQSIYSFQGAAPAEFVEQKRVYGQKIRASDKAFQAVGLGMSFRSVAAVLDVVDRVVSQPHVQRGVSVSGEMVPHEAFRAGQAGVVELWPVIRKDDVEQSDIWQVQQEVVQQEDSKIILAERIAETISGWLRGGEYLVSKNRPIRAGDVLVLIRRRDAFIYHLVRALKRAGVPVAGVDRMVLTDNIAIMDLLALAEFLLLPQDDLNLACVLKSPLCGISEEQLYALAWDRGKQSLWARVQADASMAPVTAFLGGLLERVDYIRPYELFALVLEEQDGRRRFAERLGEEVFDPLDEFLSLAMQYELNHTPSLQGFLHWVRSGDTEIKRDMEQGMDAVRIMTVHGAKGLQAPIVFLPDTTSTPSISSNLFWGQHEGEPVLLWSPGKKDDDAVISALRERARQAQLEEYCRLLYVAMTRAEDRLYVAGTLNGKQKDVPEHCWYRWIAEGAQSLMQPATRQFGIETVEIQRYETTQEAPLPEAVAVSRRQQVPPMPDMLRHAPAPEPYPPQPLVPSRADEHMAMIASPAAGAVISPVSEGERFRRGNLVHRLLQWLPDAPSDQWQLLAESYLEHYADGYSADERRRLLNEVLHVLQDPAMAPVFAAGSLAEVPLSGLVTLKQGQPPRILSGQVDRLRVTPEAVWVVDYKTQRTPPACPQEVPLPYLRQMAVYRAALAQIYPQHAIHCALLWTAAPVLMPLPDELLASLLDSPVAQA